jgi:uncharacterized membrane protein (DUF2068 family)/ABC-type Na+ transport system ATPase subunit NatA
MRSGYGTTGMAPVLAAGVGIRHGWTWVLRAASFRLEVPDAGRPAIGIAIAREAARTAVIDLLGGLTRPAYGELRVLGQDLTTAQGRAAVRRYVGIARLPARPQPGRRVRGLVGHAARMANLPGRDCDVLTAAILDRLALTPWADVPVRAAPTVIARRARLAAAAVHEPELLLIDSLLDGLGPRDTENVAVSIRDLGRDTAIVATGRDPAALAMACGEVLTLADGIIVRNLGAAATREPRENRAPAGLASIPGPRRGPGLARGPGFARGQGLARGPGLARAPGGGRPALRLVRVNWNLLACALGGHVSYAPAEPGIRAMLRADTAAGEAWQCLRCATFVPGAPGASGPAAAAPRVRRDDELRSAVILRTVAVERFIRAIIFGFIAYGVWRFKHSRYTIEHTFQREYPEIRDLLHTFGYNVNSSGGLVGLIRHTFTLDQRTLTWLAIGAAAYTVVEILEGIALWMLKRWGEYFAMVATSAGIPYEIYELVAKVTVVRMGAFVINVALVVYLVLSKRLFGARGGKKAYDARLRSESVMQAAIDAAAAGGLLGDSPAPVVPVPDGTASGGTGLPDHRPS